MIDASLSEALEELRIPLQADGADYQLEGVYEGIARVRLILGSETCKECIMSKPILEKIMTATFVRHHVPVSGVELIDPRDSS